MTSLVVILPEIRLNLVAPDVEAPVAIATLLADRNRATILAILRDGPHCVCELAAALDERSNNVSNHLARLRDAGLVRASRMPPPCRWDAIVSSAFERNCEKIAVYH